MEFKHMPHIASNSASLMSGKMLLILAFSCSNLLGSSAVVSPLPVIVDSAIAAGPKYVYFARAIASLPTSLLFLYLEYLAITWSAER